jgi:PAS domain-containing protein
LQTANEELAEQREELAAANEELRAANEEMAAQREELATANEELHEQLTRLEESQQALSESEARLREAQAIAHLGHWFYEGDSNHLYWSEEMKRIFGREPVVEELTGEGYIALVHPGDRAAVREQLFGSIATGGLLPSNIACCVPMALPAGYSCRATPRFPPWYPGPGEWHQPRHYPAEAG